MSKEKRIPENGKADAIPAKPHPLALCRAAGVPLIAWESSDPALSVKSGLRALNGREIDTPVLQHDTIRGLVGVNTAGLAAQEAMEAEPLNTQNPVECLVLLAEKCPDKALVYLHNAHRIFAEPSPTQSLPFVQALWNLRDKFKGTGATLVLLGPSFTLPVELKNDVVIVTEPLPDAVELGRIVDSIQADAGLEPFPDREKIIDALLGLSAFGAEQSLALSIRATGLDRDELWERKRKMVEQTQGLSVWRGGETFADVGGCENAKGFLRKVITGNRAARAVVLLEEMEKSLGNTGGDLSGVSADYLGCLLEFMQNKQASGVIFVGPPGCAKSMIAKSLGTEGGIPTINMDLGGMKGSLVGQSEQRIRDGLKVADAVAQGRLLFVATMNSYATIPPELKRRFNLTTMFFDLPSIEERMAIWDTYRRKFNVDHPVTFSHEGWTGAEIKQCCDVADRINCTLEEASKFIVPVAKSAADTIEALRKQASGKFISASYAGVYRYEKQAQPAPTGRLMGV